MKRRWLRILARGLIGAVLNAQLALAAYACPQVMAALAAPHLDERAVSAASAMPDCSKMGGAMEASTANLCAEHCKIGQQSDQVPTLALPAVLLMARYDTPFEPQRTPAPRSDGAWSSALIAASPPLAVAHCCWRV